MIGTVMTVAVIYLVVLVFLSLWRAAMGPTVPDRVAAINMIGTKTIAIMVLVGYLGEQRYFTDVGMVYALIAFLMTVGMAKYMERGRLD